MSGESKAQIFGGAALRQAVEEAGGGDNPSTVVVVGGAGSATGPITYVTGGAVASELSRRFSEAEVDAVRGGGGGGTTAAPYCQRYYPGRTFVSGDDVAASVLTKSGTLVSLQESLQAAAPDALRVALKKGYVLAGLVELEALAEDPLVDPEALAGAVADLNALTRTARRGPPPTDSTRGGAPRPPTGAKRAAAPLTPIPLPALAADEGDLAPPPRIRRRPAETTDAEEVQRLEARMVFYLTALGEWAALMTRHIEAARAALRTM